MYYEGENKCKLVRETSAFVVNQAKHVTINQAKIQQLAKKYHYKKFNEFEHHDVGEDEQTILKYLFVLDSCNFCFWPLEGFQYQQLAGNIQKYIKTGVTLQQLANITEQQLVNGMFSGIKVPLSMQRARLVREVCSTTLHKFNGSFVQIVKKANKSSVQLVNILSQNFPNFQDHEIYKGHQIFFLKRAQILVAGIWGMHEGKGLGQFKDIDQLTMFADYRVPQILHQYKILEYTKLLQQKIFEKVQIYSGSEQEVEIRAATVVAVQMIKQFLNQKLGVCCFTLEVDSFLWQLGQSMLQEIVPHHRTLTIYY